MRVTHEYLLLHIKNQNLIAAEQVVDGTSAKASVTMYYINGQVFTGMDESARKTEEDDQRHSSLDRSLQKHSMSYDNSSPNKYT